MNLDFLVYSHIVKHVCAQFRRATDNVLRTVCCVGRGMCVCVCVCVCV